MIALIQKIKRIPLAVLLLLFTLLIPVLSGARAEDAYWLRIEIVRETDLLDAKAKKIGTLLPDMEAASC